MIEQRAYSNFLSRSEKPSEVESTVGKSNMEWFQSLLMFAFTVHVGKLVEKQEEISSHTDI